MYYSKRYRLGAENCGEETYGNVSFTPNTWNKVGLHMRLNTNAAASDGFARLFIDGAPVAERYAIRYRAVDGSYIVSSIRICRPNNTNQHIAVQQFLWWP
jgi:hypothetical protein